MPIGRDDLEKKDALEKGDEISPEETPETQGKGKRFPKGTQFDPSEMDEGLEEGQKVVQEEDAEGDENLLNVFEHHLDDEGNFPSFMDGVFADVPTREVAEARDNFYEATQQPRYRDYLDTSREVNQIQQGQGENLGIGTQIMEGMKRQVNLGIKALNNLTDSNIKELETIKSADEAAITQIVGSYGGVVAGGLVAPALATAAGLGAAVAGAISLGVVGLHSYVATYDNPENMSRYDTFWEDLLPSWEGFISDAGEEVSRASMMTKIFLSEVVDSVTFAVPLKLIGKGAKALRGGKKASLVRDKAVRAANALADEGRISLAARETADEIGEIAVDVKKAHYNEEVLNGLRARRMLLDPKHNYERMVMMHRKAQAFLDTVKSSTDVARFARGTLKSAGDYAGSAKRSLHNVITGRGDEVKQLDKYIGSMYHRLRDYRGIIPREGEETLAQEALKEIRKRGYIDTYITGGKKRGSPMLATMSGHRDLFEKLAREKMRINPRPEVVKRLEMAHELAGFEVEYVKTATGSNLQAIQNVSHIQQSLGRLEDMITKTIAEAAASTGKVRNDLLAKARRAMKKRRLIFERNLTGDEDLWDSTATVAIRAQVDNLIANAALSTALMGSVTTGFYEATLLGWRSLVRGEGTYPLRLVLKRSKKVFQEKMKKRYRGKGFVESNTIRELRGKGRIGPDRFDTTPLPSKTRLGQTANILSGINLQAMRELDNVMESAFEALIEQVALKRVIDADLAAGKTLEEVGRALKSSLTKGGDEAFIIRYNSEIKRSLDWIMFKADIRPEGNWINDFGVRLYEVASDLKAKFRNPVARVTFGQLGIFSRSFANALSNISANSFLGTIGPGFRQKAARFGQQAVSNPTAALQNRRLFGTLAGMSTLYFFDSDDDEALVDVVEGSPGSNKLARRFGRESGLRIGSRQYKWMAFGTLGEVARSLQGLQEAWQLWTDHPLSEVDAKLLNSALEVGRLIAEESWLGMGIGRFYTAFRVGGDFRNKVIIDHYKNFLPARGFYNRVATAAYGGASPRDSSLNPVMTVLEDFIEAVDEATPRTVRRDMFGTPWNKAESRQGTQENIDAWDRLIWFFNPAHKGDRPRTNELTRWVMEAGGFNEGAIKIGDKWIPSKTIAKVLNMPATNIRPPSRAVVLALGGNNNHMTLSPDGYNNKLGIMSLDGEFANQLLDSYKRYYEGKFDGGVLGERNQQALRELEVLRGYLRPDNIGGYLKDYASYEKGDQLVDMLWKVAKTPTNKMPSGSRQLVTQYRNALRLALKNSNLYSPGDRFTDAEIDDLADRTARLFVMNKMYREIERIANYVMAISPEADKENTKRYNLTKR